jgi:hypothetical protein
VIDDVQIDLHERVPVIRGSRPGAVCFLSNKSLKIAPEPPFTSLSPLKAANVSAAPETRLPPTARACVVASLDLREVLPDDLCRGNAHDVTRLPWHGPLHEKNVVADADNLPKSSGEFSSGEQFC